MDLEVRIRQVVMLLPPEERITIATLATWLHEHDALGAALPRKEQAPAPETPASEELKGREVAQLLRVSPSTVRQRRLDGDFANASYIPGKGWMYPRADVDLFIAEQRSKAQDRAARRNAQRAKSRSAETEWVRSDSVSPSPMVQATPSQDGCSSVSRGEASSPAPGGADRRQKRGAARADDQNQRDERPHRRWRQRAMEAGLQ